MTGGGSYFVPGSKLDWCIRYPDVSILTFFALPDGVRKRKRTCARCSSPFIRRHITATIHAVFQATEDGGGGDDSNNGCCKNVTLRGEDSCPVR